MLGQLEADQRAVVADMEAGAGNLTRMQAGSIDLLLLVTEPSPRSIEVARRASDIITERKIGPALVVANKVRSVDDRQRIEAGLPGLELVVIPEDPEVLLADREAHSPLDTAPDAPAVRAVRALSDRLAVRFRGGVNA